MKTTLHHWSNDSGIYGEWTPDQPTKPEDGSEGEERK